MDESAASGLAAFGVIGTLFVIVLAILWILVPFAIFGIKGLLRDILHEHQRTNAMIVEFERRSRAAVQVAAAGDPRPAVETSDNRTRSEILGGSNGSSPRA